MVHKTSIISIWLWLLPSLLVARDVTTLQPQDPSNGGWALQITGQDANDTGAHDDFKSVCVVPGAGTTPSGDTWREDQIYTVVERVIDSNTVTTIELFTPVDWQDPNYCWFVDCASGDRLTRYQPGQAGVPGTPAVNNYPTLRTVASQADPGLTHTTAIANVTDLQNMSLNLTGNYYLTGNIDASATSGWNGGLGFAPIGPDGFTAFTGTLDGGGYTITGLTINRPATSYVGLFGHLGSAGKVANLTLANVSITGLRYVGAIAGYAKQPGAAGSALLIQNCHTSGAVNLPNAATAQAVGGLVGWAICEWGAAGRLDFVDSTSSCTITDNFTAGYAGGLVGITWGGGGTGYEVRFRNCSATGAVTSGGQHIGGLVGNTHNDAIINDCHATGNLSGVGYVGGLVGDLEASATVARCYATGTITNSGNASGGFTGALNPNATIADCYASGDVTAVGNSSGGFCGSTAAAATCTIDRCYSTGTVSGVLNVGGFNGQLGVGSLITDCYWDTETSGEATSDGGTGKTTAEMKTQATYVGWDFTTIWYMANTPGTPEIPAVAEAWLTHDGTQLDGASVCVYADAIPRGSFTMDGNDISGFTEADYTVVIAGLNYWSKLETMPLIVSPDPNTIIADKKLMALRLDLQDAYGFNYAMGSEATPVECSFGEIISSVVTLSRVTWPFGSQKKACIYIEVWDPTPLGIRALVPEIVFYRP